MPRIQSPWALESTVTGWNSLGTTSVISFRPKFSTGDNFKLLHGRLPYRDDLNLAQVYTGFGKVLAIYQQALNSCLVVFKDLQSARIVANNRELGLPYGRLYARWWKPLSQDTAYLLIMKHLEKAAETRTRFHSLMDKDDRMAAIDPIRCNTRRMAEANKLNGPNLHEYLSEGVKIAEALTKHKPHPEKPPRKYGGPRDLTKSTELSELIQQREKLVVVDFYARWCGPCRNMAPIYEQLAQQFPDVIFAKVDVDICNEIAEECGVSALPTFLFYKNGKKVDHLLGAKHDLLREKIIKHR